MNCINHFNARVHCRGEAGGSTSVRLLEAPETRLDVDLDAEVLCSSMHATGEPAIWAGVMSDCRHLVTSCDEHRERVEGRPGTPWWHTGCSIHSGSIEWRRL